MSVEFEFHKDGTLREDRPRRKGKSECLFTSNDSKGFAVDSFKALEHEADIENGNRTLDDLLTELDELVGLSEVKRNVRSLINLVRAREARKAAGYEQAAMSLHLVFTGNPGTGKTTVARLLSEIYRSIGVLPSGHLVEVDRSGLVGGYVGQTAMKVQEVVERANGGILFIDEAYALTVNRGDTDYGFEAVDTLLKAMEDKRDSMIVIVAGYTDPMKDFLNSNPGLISRFNNYIDFPDYEAEELQEIFLRMCQKNHLQISDEAKKHSLSHFTEKVARKEENFANAREVRNFFEKTLVNQANRIASYNQFDNEELLKITLEDVS